jgi:hypothetical protein
MANTLTGLIAIIYRAMNTISREMVGFIPSVYRNSEAEAAAKDQTIRYPIVATRAAADITPAATGPNPSGETVTYGDMTISKSRSVSFPWNGEEQVSLGNQVYADTLQQQFEQAMRTLTNEIEVDLAALYKYASRAYGTAGTSPFGTNLAESAQILKILKDNGAPTTQLRGVIDTAAGAAMRTLAQLTKANEAGSDDMRALGILLDLHGIQWRESGQITAHTPGTAASYLADLTAGYAVGTKTFHVDTGTGTFLAGDILTNTKTARDSNKYVVATGFAGDGDGDVVLAAPGIRKAWVNNDPVAVGAAYTPNMVFDQNAIHLVSRLPAMPEGGDSAEDVLTVTDPISGLVFQVAVYRQYRQVSYEVAIAWGVKAVKVENIALLLG